MKWDVYIVNQLVNSTGSSSVNINEVPSITESISTEDIDKEYIDKLSHLKSTLDLKLKYYQEKTDATCKTTIRELTEQNKQNTTSYSINYVAWRKWWEYLQELIKCNIFNSEVWTLTIEFDYEDLPSKVDENFKSLLLEYVKKWYKINYVVRVQDYNKLVWWTNIIWWGWVTINKLILLVVQWTSITEEELKKQKDTMIGIKNFYEKYYKVNVVLSVDSKYSSIMQYISKKSEWINKWVKAFDVPPTVVTIWEITKLESVHIMIRDDIEKLLWTKQEEMTNRLLTMLNTYQSKIENKEIKITYDFNISKGLAEKLDWIYLEQQLRNYSNIEELVLPNSMSLIKASDFIKDLNHVLDSEENKFLESRDREFLRYKYKADYLEYLETNK